MKMTNVVAVALLLAALPTSGWAQRSPRFFLAAGPYRIDRLAGTPIVPTIGLLKPVGQRGAWGIGLSGIRNAGFYSLNALALDLHIGLRTRPGPVEGFGTVGPATMLGGDGDGSPYARLGLQASVGGTWWVGRHVGVIGFATGRVWVGTGSSENRFSPGASAGIVVRP